MCVTSKKKAAYRSRPQCSLFFCVFPDYGNLFYVLANGNSFQCEYHIRCPLEESYILFPAHAAFAMLQTRKLLFHLPAAVGANFIAGTHINRPAFGHHPAAALASARPR